MHVLPRRLFVTSALLPSLVLGPANAVPIRLSLEVRHAAAKQQAWPATYYDGSLTSYNPKEKILSVSNVGALQMLWTQNVSGGVWPTR